MVVEVSVPQVPAACKPSHARITLDVNDDGQPGVSRLYPLRGERERLRLARPRHFSDHPDTAVATAVTARGLSGESVTVLISEP